MIWIIGGTSEAKNLIRELTGKMDFVVTVATYSGAEMLDAIDENVIVNRMDQQAMIDFINERRIQKVIDMSHPYALEVTQNAKTACKETGIAYLRYSRKSSELADSLCINTIENCASILANVKGCVFFTTGIKNIKDFEKIKGDNRFIYRVLPSLFSIQECVDNGVKMEDIVAILGPVSEELNYQMFKDFDADYVIMKDSGKEGGTLEKIRACKRLGITPVVIERQTTEDGVDNLDKLLEMIL